MPVAILLTDPATPTLDHDLVEAVRARWDGGRPRWLAPGEAAEFDLAPWPADGEAVGSELRARGVDLGIVESAGRRKRLLLADMDSTMIGQECIDELADLAGVGPQVAAITARAMDGALDFEGALRERVALLAGLPDTVIGQVLEERITEAPGGRVLVATMRAAGAHAALVSGGFMAFADAVAARLGFDEARANTLEVASGRLTGRVVPPVLGRAAKVTALRDIASRLGIGSGEVLAVGDGANDLGMLAEAGMGVALHAKPSVAAEAGLRIDHGDLTALLYLQGIAREAFIGG